jgi:hypothetical protein
MLGGIGLRITTHIDFDIVIDDGELAIVGHLAYKEGASAVRG